MSAPVFSITKAGEHRAYVIAASASDALKTARLFGVLGDGDYVATEVEALEGSNDVFFAASQAINAER